MDEKDGKMSDSTNALEVIKTDQIFDDLSDESVPDSSTMIYHPSHSDYPVYFPGNKSDYIQVRKAMNKIDLRSDARLPSEIVRVFTNDGSEQYDFPAVQENQPVMARIHIARSARSKELSILARVISRNNIHVSEIYRDTNPSAKGYWIRVDYVDVNNVPKSMFNKLREFTIGDINNGAWENILEDGSVTEKDIKVLREYLSTLIRNLLGKGTVKVVDGTSFIGWSDNFKKYTRPGYQDSGTRGLYTDTTASSWTAKGDFSTQRKILLDMFAESPRALMIAGFATAGLLLRALNIGDNYIVALIGHDSSSLGKSTLMRVIKSFFTACDQLKTFDSTTKALKTATLYQNDCVALVDEIGSGKLDAKERDALVYGLASGVARDSLVKVNGEWECREEKPASRFTVIMSGEESLIDQQKAKKGVKIRSSQVLVSEEKRIWSFNDNSRIEQAMRDLSEHHGHIFPRIVEMIQETDDFVPLLNNLYHEHLEEVRERCGKSEKAKRKGIQVALAQMGVLMLEMVLDSNKEHGETFAPAMDAAHELLDDFIQEETSSDLLGILLSLPTALAPFLAVDVDDGSGRKSIIPNRMIGSAFHRSTRYQHKQIKNGNGEPVLSVSDKPSPGPDVKEIKGTVITLIGQTAGPVIKEKLDVDLKMLVDEAIRMGWAKLRTYEKGFRKTPMVKFIVDAGGTTRNNTGYEFIIPDDYEQSEVQDPEDVG